MSQKLVDVPSAETPIAIIGMGCWLPGASSPRQLWENVLARRREFRRMPDVRTPLSDYYDETGKDPDKFYQSKVAVIDGFDFDWASYRIPESSYLRTDVCQWLALEIANRALQDAGFSRETAPKDKTGVFIGNTCTGEGMRSNSLRLRWPVVQRALTKAAELGGISSTDIAPFMKTTEDCYKSIFPDVNEDFVAGSISATIAGRICNYFDFHGGAFVIDGACASSLASVMTALNMLASHDLDLALAGGVDISLDPFELVGFSRNGALSKSEIRPYDKRGDGFIAGEGGGLVVLKRLADARRDGNTVYAVIRGWGMASDGKAGIMQPVASQQAAAIQRAVERAGCKLADLDFVEGHGTGTRAGDRTELEGLSLAMTAEAGDAQEGLARGCGIGSLKSLIGHTKATAGVASLIKAAAAVNRRVLPPTAGCDEPNDAFEGKAIHLFPIRQGEIRPADSVVQAGVSAFGFGGINTHLIIESGDAPSPRLAPQADERALLASHQESELFVFGGETRGDVLAQVVSVAADALLLSQGDLADLAAALADELPPATPYRAAVVATNPDDLAAKLGELRKALAGNRLSAGKPWAKPAKDIYVGGGQDAARIGFLFPGQGSHQLQMARTLLERFDWARELAEEAESAVADQNFLDLIYRPIDRARDPSEIKQWMASLAATEIAQPAICLASALCARFLASLGIHPAVVGGHSLGEITALYAAGAFDSKTLFAIAAQRGQAMRGHADHPGAMASLACSQAEAETLMSGISGTVGVANINSPHQTVISGEAEAIDAVTARAADRKIAYRRLAVSNAFHSPLVEAGARTFEAALGSLSPLPRLTVPVISGVESVSVDANLDLRHHLARQITSPVNFVALAEQMRNQCDVFIEVGPGRTLSGLCRDIFNEDDVCTPLAADALKWNPNPAVAVAFINGVGIDWQAFYAQRLVRPYQRPSERIYLTNPAERPVSVAGVASPRGALPARAVGHSLEAALSSELGLTAEHMAEYLRHRGHFLAGVARLDMASLANSAGRPAIELPKPAAIAQLPIAAERGNAIGASSLGGVTELIIDLVSKRSGYPAASISADSRLLDDLNLDSIKAGELVAEASRRVGAAGKIDATRFANSKIAEIATVLFEAAPKIAATPTVTSQAQSGEAGAAVSTADIVELLFDLTSQRTGYPRASIGADSRLLDDLNLDSIKAGELVAEASRRIGAAGKIDATRFANASLKDIAAALGEVLPASRPAPEAAPQFPASSAPSAHPKNDDLSFVSRYGTWTRNFVVNAVPTPRAENVASANLTGQVFLVFFDPRDPEPAQALCSEIAAREGSFEQVAFDVATRSELQHDTRFTHQIAVLPRLPAEGAPLLRVAEIIFRLISLAQVPVKNGPADRSTIVAYVQFGGGMLGYDDVAPEPELCNALAFARTLHLERKDLRIRVLDFATSIAAKPLADHVLEEMGGDAPFMAVGFDAEDIRREPLVTLSAPVSYRPRSIDWSERDVVLVTGGAKGIMAECALGVARETGATLVLVGRGAPGSAGGSDAEIDRTLERFRAEGLPHFYYSCDIVDAAALAETIAKIEAEAGAITAVIHGASVLRPSRTENLTVDGLLQEISPKVLGAWNLCQALRQKPLKLFVAFSSLVVDHGMPWSAGYCFANELMERVVRLAATGTPSLPLQIVSYGLWGQVGRPAVLKTNDHLLSVGLHDGEIPPEEGVRRLVEIFTLDPAVQRLCIYGRSAGYPTWDQLRPALPVPKNLRFVERVLHAEPDVELIARCHLSLQRDRYLHDHVYNGMYIVPTVLALEAIAQAASVLTGDADPLCRLEGVEMPYPIVVDPANGLEIELHAEVQEATADGTRRINVSVATEQSGFKTSVLSGTAVFGHRRAARSQSTTLGKPLPIDARADLYDRQFFVGPSYQRMSTIYSVDPDRAICLGEVHAEEIAACEVFSAADAADADRLVLGDPLFRDTLLHSSLLHHLDHMAFTVRIDKIEFFEGCEATQTDQRLCIARLCWSGGKDAEYELVAATKNGHVTERWTGFCTKALARTSDWPALQDLLDVERSKAKDEAELTAQIAWAADELGVAAPSVALACVVGLSDLPIEDRHVCERALADRVVALAAPEAKQKPKLTWHANGRPQLESEVGLDISFSHEGWYCLCTTGSDAQGCDLAAISHRDEAEWSSLLGQTRTPLLASLSADEPQDVAGTRIWAAIEAGRKALATDQEELTLVKRAGTYVLFRAHTSEKDALILTLPLRFSHGRKCIAALTVAASAAIEEPGAEPAPMAQIVRDERLGCDVLEYEFSVSWKECTTASHKVMAGCYVDWFHRTREAMLSQQDARRWVAGVLDGTAGLVARSIHVQVHDEATAHDELCGRIWITQLSENGVRWHVDFFNMARSGVRTLVATVEAEGGMVGIDSSGSRSRGVASVARDYGRFVQAHSAAPEANTNSGFDGFQKGARVFDAPPGPQGGPLLFSETVRPSLMDSDLVGNVSSITFFTWLAHVRDHFLYSVVPKAMVRRVGAPPNPLGEALCIDEEMVYLREAFPFDDITVEMRLISATERSARVRYEFIRAKQGASEKLAVGHQQLFWVRRDADGVLRSQDFPPELLRLVNPQGSVELPRVAGAKQ